MVVERSNETKRDLVVVHYDFLVVVSVLLMDSTFLKERSSKQVDTIFIANSAIFDSIEDEHKPTNRSVINLVVVLVDFGIDLQGFLHSPLSYVGDPSEVLDHLLPLRYFQEPFGAERICLVVFVSSVQKAICT